MPGCLQGGRRWSRIDGGLDRRAKISTLDPRSDGRLCREASREDKEDHRRILAHILLFALNNIKKVDRQEGEIKHNSHPADHNQQMAGFSRNCLFTRFPLLIKTVCWGFYRERGLTKAADAVPPVIPPLQLQCNHDHWPSTMRKCKYWTNSL